jgi:hypothetical protein
MRDDVLSRIGALKDIEHCFILSHDIDFIFLQSVVARALGPCGNPTVTIFADRFCARTSYESQRELLTSLGTRYFVLPVSMGPYFRFHPKAILLTSAQDADLFIGSGNLTFGGWRDNAEVWAHSKASQDDKGTFASVRRLFRRLAQDEALGQLASRRLESAFDPNFAWTSGLGGESGLVYRLVGDPPLLEQLLQVVPPARATALHVCAPYFDEHGAALRRLWEAYGRIPLNVYVPESGSNLSPAAAKVLSEIANVRAVSFRRDIGLARPSEAFVHAKFIAIEMHASAMLFIGSGNASIAALGLGGQVGNAECFAYYEGPIESIDQLLRSELSFLDSSIVPVTLDEESVTPISDDSAGSIGILRGVIRGDRLYIAFAPVGFVPSAILLDVGEPIHPLPDGHGSIFGLVEAGRRLPLSCRLEGHLAGQQVTSSTHWIDNESELSVSSVRRTIRDVLSASSRGISGDAREWGLILTLISRDANPNRDSGPRPRRSTETELSPGLPLARTDLFAVTYPENGAGLMNHGPIETGDRGSILMMLRRRFGLDRTEEEQEEEIEATDEENAVDRPEAVLVRKDPEPSALKAMSVAERRRNTKLLTDLSAVLVSDSYLSAFSPKRIGDDLTLIALLFRIGQARHWIDDDLYSSLTIAIMQPLLLARDKAGISGKLARELRLRSDPQQAIQEASSPELAAALASWIAAMPVRNQAYRAAQMYFALVSVSAHLPWIFPSIEPARARDYLGMIAREAPIQTGALFNDGELDVLWANVIRHGALLRRLENALASVTLDFLKENLASDRIEVGELTWQSSSIGFCITLAGASRKDRGANVDALTLSSAAGRSEFNAPYLIPVRDALCSDLVLTKIGIDSAFRSAILDDLLPSLSNVFSRER